MLIPTTVLSGSSCGGYTLIQEIIVGAGGAASVDFTSIPGTYRHLQMFARARSEGTATDLLLRFNNDSGANYATEVVRGIATSASAASLSGQTAANIASVPATGDAIDAHIQFVIPYYATGTATRVAVSTYGLATGSGNTVGSFAGIWTGTAAITRITAFLTGIDLQDGSIFSLYGIV